VTASGDPVGAQQWRSLPRSVRKLRAINVMHNLRAHGSLAANAFLDINLLHVRHGPMIYPSGNIPERFLHRSTHGALIVIIVAIIDSHPDRRQHDSKEPSDDPASLWCRSTNVGSLYL
jgi:hypothetical protein